ncbi:hypothetical protein Ga0123461_1261 [Mariprofundus aestuarium]|uniref:Uncharacterized protein n=1 Tax=Mariprofundus aestuarium TaxID=1921086 RepID=A0A2K8KXJ4_MARES|nr:hypothetical protein [Mariprofundus aestuarium]ATX79680.1 hypothetical protein Ga0123461_1261 [Mariprofundus aestuarium]
MYKNIKRLKYKHIYLPVFVVLWLSFFLDSTTLAKQITYNQWLTNTLVFISYIWIYSRVSKVIKQLMLFGLLVAIFGEVLFSLVLGMYTYRLDNVPIYVPFGHSIVYASIYYIAREPLVLKHKQRIYNVLFPIMIIYSSLWLLLAKDLFGFICMIVTMWLLHRQPSSKLFFLLMFFMVIYLELVGTYYQCWVWPEIWFDKLSWIPSANPPSGIGGFYFAFDVGCLWLYKHYNIKRWQRFRAIQRVRKTMVQPTNIQ